MFSWGMKIWKRQVSILVATLWNCFVAGYLLLWGFLFLLLQTKIVLFVLLLKKKKNRVVDGNTELEVSMWSVPGYHCYTWRQKSGRGSKRLGRPAVSEALLCHWSRLPVALWDRLLMRYIIKKTRHCGLKIVVMLLSAIYSKEIGLQTNLPKVAHQNSRAQVLNQWLLNFSIEETWRVPLKITGLWLEF